MAIDPFAAYRNSRDQLFSTLDQRRAEALQAPLREAQLRQAQQNFDLGQLKINEARTQQANQAALASLGQELSAGKQVTVPEGVYPSSGPLRPGTTETVPFSPLEAAQKRSDLLQSQGRFGEAAQAVDITDKLGAAQIDKFRRTRQMLQMVGPEATKQWVASQGGNASMVDRMNLTPDGRTVIDLGAQGKIVGIPKGDGTEQFFQIGAGKAASQWSDPYTMNVGGKEVLVRKDLTSGKVEQVSAGPSGGTTGNLSEAEQVQADTIGQMMANGEIAPGQVPKRGKVWTAAVTKAKQLNPTFNPRSVDSDFSLSKNPAFRQRAIAASALPEILGNMVDAGKKLDYSNVQFLGQMQKFANGQLNDPDFTKYMAIRNDALMEIASVMRMTGVTDQATQLESEAARPTMSPQALDAWLDGQMTSLAPRLKRFSKIIDPKPSLRIGSEYQGKKVVRLGWDKTEKDGKIIAKRMAQLDDGSTVEIQ